MDPVARERHSSDPIRVMIVDDDYYAREALRALVVRDARTRVWDAIESVEAAESVLTIAAERRDPLPDVVLLDVRLDGDDRGGVDGISRLRTVSPASRILMTSVERDDATVLASMLAGADGYVWKNESTDGIVEAVLRIVDGRFVMTRSVAERVLEAVVSLGHSPDAAQVLPDPVERADLTESVRKTVYLFCFCGLSAREIAHELQLSVNTINARIKAAYAALDAGNRHEAFQRLVDRGERG
jgi:DNA-binding NarL/FixJ family response regulator